MAQEQLAKQISDTVNDFPWLQMNISTSFRMATRILQLLADQSSDMAYEIVIRQEDEIIEECVYIGQINSDSLSRVQRIRLTLVLHANFLEPTNETFMASAIYYVSEQFELRLEHLNNYSGEFCPLYYEYCM